MDNLDKKLTKPQISSKVYYSALPIEYEVWNVYGKDIRKIYVIAPCYLYTKHSCYNEDSKQTKTEYEVVFLWNQDEKTVAPAFDLKSGDLINGHKVENVFNDIVLCDSYVKMLNQRELYSYKHSDEYIKKAKNTLQCYQNQALAYIPANDLKALLIQKEANSNFDIRKQDLQKELKQKQFIRQ